MFTMNKMNYNVTFKVNNKTHSYKVQAENVLEAETAAQQKLKKDIKKDSLYEVKFIENISYEN